MTSDPNSKLTNLSDWPASAQVGQFYFTTCRQRHAQDITGLQRTGLRLAWVFGTTVAI